MADPWTIVSIALTVVSTFQSIKAQKEAKRLAKKTQSTGIELTRYGQDQAIQVVLGRRKISPAIVYRGTQENPYVDNKLPNERYYAALVWCIGEIEEIEELYFDDRPMSDFGIVPWTGEQTFTSRGGGGIGAQFTIDPEKKFYKGQGVYIEHVYGKNEDQMPEWFKEQVEDDLAGMEFRELVVSFVFLETDAEFKRFPNGEPEFSAFIKGKKIPNLANNNTVEWTDNFASQVYWYLTDTSVGVGLSPEEAEVYTQSYVDMANFGNTQDPIYTDDSLTTVAKYVPRLKSDFIIDTSETYFANLEKWLKDFNAYPIDSPNGIKLEIDREKDPVMDLTDLDVVGEVSVTNQRIEDRYNQVIIRFANEENNYVTDEIVYPETNSTLHTQLLAEDNGKHLVYEGEVSALTSPYHVKQYAEMLLSTSREGLNVQLSTDTRGWRLEQMDVITYTDPIRGWDKKPFSVRSIGLEEAKTNLTLVEYQPSNYAWSGKSLAENYPDTNLPNPFSLIKVTNLTVNYENGEYKFTWQPSGSFKTNYLFKLYDSENNEVISQVVYISEYKTKIFVAGNYTAEVYVQNQTGLSEPTIETFSTDVPAAPTVTFDHDAISAFIKASYQGVYFDLTFEARYSKINNVSQATDLGSGATWTVNKLSPNTTYYFWVRTIGLTANSDWQGIELTTDAQSQNIADAIDGLIDIPNLSQNAQDTINQIQTNITANANSAASSQFAVNTLKQQLQATETNLSDTFTAAFNVINDNVEFRQELLGYKSQVTTLENSVTANATAITQSATKIELESVKVELKGDIQNIVTGDIDAILDAAIGDIQGEVTEVRFFIGEGNLDGQQTITSFVNNIVFGQDFTTINEVQQEINSGGITGIVKQSTFNDTVTQLNSTINEQTANNRFEYLSSFAFATENNTSINAALVEAQFRLYNNEIALLTGQKGFEGSLATIKDDQTVLSDELSAQATTVTEQLARVNDSISITNQTLNNVVNENQVTATKIEELTVTDQENLATAISFVNASIGYCVDSNGNITNEVDAEQCLLTEGNEWLKLPISTVLDKAQITVNDENGDPVTLSAVSLLQALKDDTGEVLARAFFGIENEQTQQRTGIFAVQNLDGTISKLIARGATFEWQDSSGNDVLSLNTDTNKLSIDGTLTLTQAQKDELKATPLTITSTTTDTNGNTVVNFSDGSSATVPKGTGADELTVTNTTIDANGNTVVTFSDGTTATIQKGEQGEQGAGVYSYNTFTGTLTTESGGGVADPVTSFPTTTAANKRFKAASGRDPVLGDHLNINNTGTVNPFSTTKRYNGSSWVAPTLQIEGDLLVDGAISGNSGQFPATNTATDYVLRINQDPNFPLWYGKQGDSISRATAKFFVNKDGEVSKPISQAVGYSDGSYSTAPYPNGALYEQKVETVTQHKRYGNSVRIEFGVDFYMYQDHGTMNGILTYDMKIYKKGVYSDTLIKSKTYKERYSLVGFQSYSIQRMLLAVDTSGASPNNDEYYYGVFTITSDTGNLWIYQDDNSGLPLLKLQTLEVTQ